MRLARVIGIYVYIYRVEHLNPISAQHNNKIIHVVLHFLLVFMPGCVRIHDMCIVYQVRSSIIKPLHKALATIIYLTKKINV